MDDMLALSADWPEFTLSPGEVLIDEGGHGGAIWVLVEGELRVRRGDVVVSTIDQRGAVLGEMSVLLGRANTATVEAVTVSMLRRADDGEALLATDPRVTRLVAVALADRLTYVTTYLADLTNQYGDAPGLSMVANVLNSLERRSGPPATSGSARDPDPHD